MVHNICNLHVFLSDNLSARRMCLLFWLMLTPEILGDIVRSGLFKLCSPFWMICPSSQRWIMNSWKDSKENVSSFSVISVPADVLAPLGARTSAGTVMSKLGSSVYTWVVLNGLISFIIWCTLRYECIVTALWCTKLVPSHYLNQPYKQPTDAYHSPRD